MSSERFNFNTTKRPPSLNLASPRPNTSSPPQKSVTTPRPAFSKMQDAEPEDGGVNLEPLSSGGNADPDNWDVTHAPSVNSIVSMSGAVSVIECLNEFSDTAHSTVQMSLMRSPRLDRGESVASPHRKGRPADPPFSPVSPLSYAPSFSDTPKKKGGAMVRFNSRTSSASLLSDSNSGAESEINSVISSGGADRSCVISKAVARALAEKPKLTMTPYRKGDWAVDPVIVLHNAIRRELMDMYTIIWTLERRSSIETGPEMAELLEWWIEFAEFATAILSAERRAMYGGLLNTYGDEDRLTNICSRLSAGLDAIKLQCEEIEPAIHEFTAVPDQTNYDVMVLRIDSYTKSCTAYFEEVETSLNSTIMKLFLPADMAVLETTMVKMLAGAGQPYADAMVIALCRWMDIPTRDEWVRTYLDRGKQKAFAALWKRFYISHGRTAKNFEQRAAPSESGTGVGSGMPRSVSFARAQSRGAGMDRRGPLHSLGTGMGSRMLSSYGKSMGSRAASRAGSTYGGLGNRMGSVFGLDSKSGSVFGTDSKSGSVFGMDSRAGSTYGKARPGMRIS